MFAAILLCAPGNNDKIYFTVKWRRSFQDWWGWGGVQMIYIIYLLEWNLCSSFPCELRETLKRVYFKYCHWIPVALVSLCEEHKFTFFYLYFSHKLMDELIMFE
jgi:hypothetical protein